MASPSWYVASRPGEPSALTIGRSSRSLAKGAKMAGRSTCGALKGRKPVDAVMVKGSNEVGRMDGLECIWGKMEVIELM